MNTILRSIQMYQFWEFHSGIFVGRASRMFRMFDGNVMFVLANEMLNICLNVCLNYNIAFALYIRVRCA